jgi:hypothetical protein
MAGVCPVVYRVLITGMFFFAVTRATSSLTKNLQFRNMNLHSQCPQRYCKRVSNLFYALHQQDVSVNLVAFVPFLFSHLLSLCTKLRRGSCRPL